MKNKTVSTWLTFLGGALGLHRFYLKGWADKLGWMVQIPSCLGLYGIYRVQIYGLDDMWSWVLLPLLGFTASACSINALYFGLMSAERWNQLFNPNAEVNDPAGSTGWLTVVGLATALLGGTTILISSIAFSFQRFFEMSV